MGQHSIFAFCFQIMGLVFLQITMIRNECNVLPYPQKGVFRRSRGHSSKNVFLGQNPRLPFSSHFTLTVATGLSLSSNDMACHHPISKTFWLCYLCSTWNKHILVWIKRGFSSLVHMTLYLIFITTAMVFFLLLLSYYGEFFRRAKFASAEQKPLTLPSESMLVILLSVSSLKSVCVLFFVDWIPDLQNS